MIELPTIPARGRAPSPFAPPEPSEEPPGVSTPGGDYAWPGSWVLSRDESKGQTTVTWHGTASMVFPWGSFEHREQIIYHIDDAHPESASVEGEAQSVERLKDRVLTYRGELALASDRTTFHYSASRTLLRDGVVLRTRTWKEDIPRDLQ